MTDKELAEYGRLRAYFPYRKWLMVRKANGDFSFHNNLRQARNEIKEGQMGEIFKIKEK